MEEPKYVVGMGELLWDVLPEGKQIGGAPANFAYHVKQLGLESRVVSAVGADALGVQLREVLAQRGLKGEVPDVPYATGTVQVTLDAAGVPSYEICEGVAWDHIPFTPALEALARQTRAVCWGSLAQRSSESHSTICRFLDAMPQLPGTLRIFDINLRQHFYTREVITQSLGRCNVLKINDEELVSVARLLGLPEGDARQQCTALLSHYGLRMLVLTCGAEGSLVFTPGQVSSLATPRVHVVDTVGAGDSFTAALVASLLEGRSVREAHERAVRVSAFVCTQAGAMPQYDARDF